MRLECHRTDPGKSSRTMPCELASLGHSHVGHTGEQRQEQCRHGREHCLQPCGTKWNVAAEGMDV